MQSHLAYVRGQACVRFGRHPSDAHHLRFAQVRALGRKVSDEFTIPLCRIHHQEAHRHGNEIEWWKRVGIDPLATAQNLWQASGSRENLAISTHLDGPN